MKLYLAKDLTGPPKIRKNRVSIFVCVCVWVRQIQQAVFVQ